MKAISKAKIQDIMQKLENGGTCRGIGRELGVS